MKISEISSVFFWYSKTPTDDAEISCDGDDAKTRYYRFRSPFVVDFVMTDECDEC